MRREDLRKLVHIAAGIILALLIRFGFLDAVSAGLILVLGILLSLISRTYRIPLISSVLERVDRAGRMPGKGALTFMLGVLIVLILFGSHRDIASASVMVLGLGDAFASLVGIRLRESGYLRRTTYPWSTEKALEASAFGFLAASLGAMVFVSVTEALLGSFIGMAIEALELRFRRSEPIDDNIVIPVAAATSILVFRLLYPLFVL